MEASKAISKVKGPPSKTLNRREKRKAERKLKKQRKDAFAHRKFELVKTLKDIDSEYNLQSEQEKEVEVKTKKKRRKAAGKSKAKKAEQHRIQEIQAKVDEEEIELKQLEKKLKLHKMKGKSRLPQSFTDDGLDYLLDATESDKIKDFDDIAQGIPVLEDSESDFNDEEDSFEDINHSDTEPKQTWNPDREAGKSILKSDKKKNKNKSVKFSVSKDEDESDDSDDSDEEENLDLVHDDDHNDDDHNDDDDDHNDDDEDHNDLDDAGENSEDDNKAADELSDEDNKEEVVNQSKKRKLSEETEELKEDIYGRLKDKEGNIVKTAYVPPAKRAMMAGNKPNEALQKKLKGLVNKISEGTIQFLSNQIESLYLEHSRADVNETLCGLIMESVVANSLTPEHLVAETAMLIAILHSNVGSEVGAFFLQKLVVKFQELFDLPDYGIGKKADNVLMLLSNLYNFKIVSSTLIIDLMQKLINQFGTRDIELLLLLFKTVGFTLRKDDPAQLKQVILDTQVKAREAENSSNDGVEYRVKFMLEILTAVRNNNMRKIPGYDPSHLEHLRKLVKSFLRGQVLGDNILTIGLVDFLKADQCGRWWIVGSAWDGQRAKDDNSIKDSKAKTKISEEMSGMNEKMLKLAKQQGMNTDVRRHIFCILGSSEDFEDAFSRLLRLGLNRSQEREIIHVVFHCCLNEKTYNPFYAFLAEKFCTFDRRFAITVQFTMWDKFKEVDTMEKESRAKLGHFLSHLLLSKAVSLSVLKVVEFGMESKKMIRLLVQVLSELLSTPNFTTVTELFERIAPFSKLKSLCQGLQVFMRVHLKGIVVKGLSSTVLQERIEKVESAMFSQQSMML